MFTYQVRSRVLRTNGTELPEFPVRGAVNFYLSPSQPFGVEAGGGHTAVRATPARAFFNANTGAHSIESNPPLQPLNVTLTAPDQEVTLSGAKLTVAQNFDSLESLSGLLDGVYFVVPALLAVEYADPPIIERVDGELGGIQFRWELDDWKGRFRTTTQEQQEEAFALAWERVSLFTATGNRRLMAALHYFHVAARLARAANVAGEFLPEMILNLSKVLEVLFPAGGKVESLDAARLGLERLGYAKGDIEADFLPAMALRNHIDVGHVGLAIFKLEQLKLIHGYTERAEHAFRALLANILKRVESGSYIVTPYEVAPATGKALKVLEKLRGHAGRNAA